MQQLSLLALAHVLAIDRDGIAWLSRTPNKARPTRDHGQQTEVPYRAPGVRSWGGSGWAERGRGWGGVRGCCCWDDRRQRGRGHQRGSYKITMADYSWRQG